MQAGGCNEGFLRDDAILVVTFITDEEDTGSAGNPDSWKQTLVDAKGGNEEAIVVLGLVALLHVLLIIIHALKYPSTVKFEVHLTVGGIFSGDNATHWVHPWNIPQVLH